MRLYARLYAPRGRGAGEEHLDPILREHVAPFVARERRIVAFEILEDPAIATGVREIDHVDADHAIARARRAGGGGERDPYLPIEIRGVGITSGPSDRAG